MQRYHGLDAGPASGYLLVVCLLNMLTINTTFCSSQTGLYCHWHALLTPATCYVTHISVLSLAFGATTHHIMYHPNSSYWLLLRAMLYGPYDSMWMKGW